MGTMKYGTRLYLMLLVLLVGGLLLMPSIRWPVYGWLRGELFFQGMPTSYWRCRSREYSMHYYYSGGVPGRDYRRDPSWFEQLLNSCRAAESSTPDLFLDGDPSAVPMLVVLLQTGEPQTQLVAANGLLWVHLLGGRFLPVEQVKSALQSAIPALQEAAEAADKDVRKSGLDTLWSVDPKIAMLTQDKLDNNKH